MKKKVLFSIIGGIIGIPLSYFFQPEIVKSKVGGIGGYLSHFDEIIKEQELLSNIFISVVIFIIIGAVIGYLVDKSELKKQD